MAAIKKMSEKEIIETFKKNLNVAFRIYENENSMMGLAFTPTEVNTDHAFGYYQKLEGERIISKVFYNQTFSIEFDHEYRERMDNNSKPNS
ncbi:MAG: hypothetical protein PHE56_09510 [Bacteroidales bacterium]|nr:hypothetical protein [Bacteroidales bacterium]